MHPAKARRFAAATGLLFVALLLLPVLLQSLDIYPSLKEKTRNIPDELVAFYQREPLKILKTGMPLLGWCSFEGETTGMLPSQVLLNTIGAVGGVNLHSPAAVLQSQISLLAAVEAPETVVVNGPVENPAGDVTRAKAVFALPGDCLVGIYNTHTGETYAMSDGVERLDGRRGGVVTVAAALQEALESKYGVKVARSDRINDANYNNSYPESEKTARELLAANPKIKVLLDVHRDSGKSREQSVVNINGQEAAPILFIVGSDTRRPFPAWRQNHAFAVELSNRMNQLYPGLSLGVRVKDGLYNQFLHPHAVLVEVGTTKNSTGEAVRSARMLADVLAGVIGVDEKDKTPAEAEEQ
jgi:stage II sporulation protein P